MALTDLGLSPQQVLTILAGLLAGLITGLTLLDRQPRRLEREAKLKRQREERYDKRLEDAEDFALESFAHCDAWYEGAARAKGREIVGQAAETRRKEAQRRVRTKDIEADYEQIATYASARYGLDSKTVMEKLRKFDEREFKLLNLAIKHTQEVGNGTSKLKTDLDRSEEQGAGISAQTRRDSRGRTLPTWGGHHEERW